MNVPSPIVDRIRKLLELSKSSNEHEAAAAATRAAELMRKHELNEVMLRVTDSERHAEPIVEDGITGTRTEGRRVAWKVFIASGAAQALGIEMFSCGGRSASFGKATPIGQVSSRSGLVAGRDAGATVNLTGGGRGLPAPAKAIKG